MLLVIAEFLLSFPLFHVALDDLEALRLFQIHTDRHFLAAYIQLNGFPLAYLLLLLHAQFDVVDLLHVLEFLLQLNIRDTAMNDGFGFGIELQILLGFLAVDLHGFLDDLTFTQPLRFLLRQTQYRTAFLFKHGPYRISHECRVAVFIRYQLKFEGKCDKVSVPGTDGHLQERCDLSGSQFLLHFLREAVGLFPLYLQQQIEYFTKKGICVYAKKENLRTLDENGEEDRNTKFIIGIIAMIAEQEVATLKSRSISSKRNKIIKEGNSYTYKAPYGYDYSTETKKLSINEEEAKTVRRVIELSANDYSSARIALILNAENIPTRSKTKIWTMGTINTMLSNPVYKGEAEYMLKGTEPKKGKRYKRPIEVAIVKTPAIVSAELFDLSREKMKGRAFRSKSTGVKHFQLLRGLIYCPYCKIKYTYEGGRDLYVCHDKHKKAKNKPDCFSKAIKATRIEKIVWELVRLLFSQELATGKAQEQEEPLRQEIEAHKKLLIGIENKLNDLTAQANAIVNAAIDIKREMPNMPDLYINKLREAASLDKESKKYQYEKDRLNKLILSCEDKIKAINSLSNEKVLVDSITDDMERYELIHKVIDHMVIYGEDSIYSLVVVTFKTGQEVYIGYKSKGYQYYTIFHPSQSVWFDTEKRLGYITTMKSPDSLVLSLETVTKEYSVTNFIKVLDVPKNRRYYENQS